MEKKKQLNKGITLISLAITILVLIILATVSIATLTGDNGLLSRATKTAKMANETEAREQVEVAVLRSFDERGEIDLEELNKNLSKIPGLEYNGKSLGSGNKIDKLPVTLEVDGYEITIDEEGNVLGVLLAGQTSQSTQKDNYKDESGDTATVPKGFTVSDAKDNDGNYTENKVDTGLVVKNSNGNEFVWVPVPDISTIATFVGGNYHDKNAREPELLSSDLPNFSNHPDISQEIWQLGYNKMIESVDKYKGFYVGRYEMSYNNLSKKGETSISSSDIGTMYQWKAWYGLYGLVSTVSYKSLGDCFDSVCAGMMYAGQYDWMMNWMKENGVNTLSSTPVPGASPNNGHINGSTESDKINNVYDLLGNRKWEWTQGVYNHAMRIFVHAGALADSYMYDPLTESNDLGTRVTLYIRDDVADDTTTGGDAPPTTGQEDETKITDNYNGYYADVDGNGTVDGIIYQDMGYGKASKEFKKYTVGQEVGGFGSWRKPMISISKTGGTSGKDRFYVMALKDVGKYANSAYYWYHSAYQNEDIGKLVETSSNGRTDGKINTKFMIDKYNNDDYGLGSIDDIWGGIQESIENPDYNLNTWFVPSYNEWEAFEDMLKSVLKHSTNDYSDLGLQNSYWSSTLKDYAQAWMWYQTGSIGGVMHYDALYNSHPVRMSATF